MYQRKWKQLKVLRTRILQSVRFLIKKMFSVQKWDLCEYGTCILLSTENIFPKVLVYSVKVFEIKKKGSKKETSCIISVSACGCPYLESVQISRILRAIIPKKKIKYVTSLFISVMNFLLFHLFRVEIDLRFQFKLSTRQKSVLI